MIGNIMDTLTIDILAAGFNVSPNLIIHCIESTANKTNLVQNKVLTFIKENLIDPQIMHTDVWSHLPTEILGSAARGIITDVGFEALMRLALYSKIAGMIIERRYQIRGVPLLSQWQIKPYQT